jgi:hypothetical protein
MNSDYTASLILWSHRDLCDRIACVWSNVKLLVALTSTEDDSPARRWVLVQMLVSNNSHFAQEAGQPEPWHEWQTPCFEVYHLGVGNTPNYQRVFSRKPIDGLICGPS